MKVSLLDKIISKTGQIAILIDPEKTNSADKLNELISRIHQHQVDYIFIGGSSCTNIEFEKTASIIKPLTNIPIIIFPGSSSQITKNADGILLLSLLSGRNSKYLIEEHIDSSLKLRKSVLEIIPTSYILINGETESSVKKISNTIPLSRKDSKTILKTTLAGLNQGKKITFFDCGSGAKKSVPYSVIKLIKQNSKSPLIVGGGINSTKKINIFKKLGVNIIVVGNFIEQNSSKITEILPLKSKG